MEDEGGTDIDDLASVTQRDGKDQPVRRMMGELGFLALSYLGEQWEREREKILSEREGERERGRERGVLL